MYEILDLLYFYEITGLLYVLQDFLNPYNF